MIYVDTSAWVALHVSEVHTVQMQDWLETQEIGELSCAEWVKTEYASALSLKRRRGDLNAENFTQAHRAFAEICVAGPAWLDVLAEDFLAAAGLCADPQTSLRAGDALHLAVALRSKCEGFLSLDAVLNENARRLGLRLVRL